MLLIADIKSLPDIWILDITQELKRVGFVRSPLLICNLCLLQISSYEAEYLNGKNQVIDSRYSKGKQLRASSKALT